MTHEHDDNYGPDMNSLAGAAAQQFIDGAPDGILVVDANGRITTINARLTEMLGYSAEQLLGEPIEKLVPADFQSAHQALRSAYIDEPTQRQLGDPGSSLIARCADDTLLPVEIALSPIEVKGSPATMAIVRDSTRRVEWQLEREAVEREIANSEARFRSAFDDASVPMAIVDLSEPSRRRIVLANDALAALLGFTVQDLTGNSLAALTHPDDRQQSALGAEAMLRGTPTYHAEERLKRADGTDVWTQIDASTIDGIDGSTHALAHIIDISRRVDAEQERDRREQLLTDLAAIRKAALDEAPVGDILQLVVDAALLAAHVDHCFVASPNASGELVCSTMASPQAADYIGRAIAADSAIARVYRTAEDASFVSLPLSADLFVSGSAIPTFGPCRMTPMQTAGTIEGVLVAARSREASPIEPADEARIDALAAEAAVALLLGKARRDRRQMLLIEDRERIARDLHDVVIQRLFATGMSLQASLGANVVTGDRIEQAITDLDEIIAVIRNTIFQLTRTDDSLEAEIERVIDRHRALGRSSLAWTIDGPLDAVPPRVRDHLIPTLNELLSNVERHANASITSVDLRVTESSVVLIVDDDGDGFALDGEGGFGLRNLRDRADRLGGTTHLTSPTNVTSEPATGSRIEWQVPLEG